MNEDINRLQKQIDELKRQMSLQGQTQNYGVDFSNLTNVIEVVTSDPSVDSTGAITKPDTVYGQIKIYYDSTGPTWKLYIYDRTNRTGAVNGVWKSVTLT